MIVFLGTTCWDQIIRRHKQRDVETWMAEHYEAVGGNAPNAAVTAAALGSDVALVSALGQDEPAEEILAAWKMYPQMQLALADIHQTPNSFIVTGKGPRQIFTEPPRPRISPFASAESLLRRADVADFYPSLFRVDDWYPLLPPRRARSLHGIEEEAQAGRKWSFLVDSAEKEERPSQDVIEGVEAEIVVRTAGARGGEYLIRGASWRKFSAPSVTEVDSVGAGDGFRGALLAGLERGWSAEEAVCRAAEIGSQAAARRGGFPRSLDVADCWRS